MNAQVPVGVDVELTSACPACQVVASRTTYDVGSGPELSCINCEWCWGANGQDLQPLDVAGMTAHVQRLQADG